MQRKTKAVKQGAERGNVFSSPTPSPVRLVVMRLADQPKGWRPRNKGHQIMAGKLARAGLLGRMKSGAYVLTVLGRSWLKQHDVRPYLPQTPEPPAQPQEPPKRMTEVQARIQEAYVDAKAKQIEADHAQLVARADAFAATAQLANQALAAAFGAGPEAGKVRGQLAEIIGFCLTQETSVRPTEPPNTGTLTVRVRGVPFPIEFADWTKQP